MARIVGWLPRCLIFTVACWMLPRPLLSDEEKPKICSKKQPKVQGKTIEDCKNSAKQLWDYMSQCSDNPTAYFSKDIMTEEGRCYRKIMIDELDKRLIPLKTENPAQFKAEMKLQAEFNQPGNDFCTQTDHSMTGEGYYGCMMLLDWYRARQAIAINQKNLTVTGSKPIGNESKLFRSFAEGLCAMPAEVWQQKAAPADCIEKVLGELEKAVGINSDD